MVSISGHAFATDFISLYSSLYSTSILIRKSVFKNQEWVIKSKISQQDDAKFRYFVTIINSGPRKLVQKRVSFLQPLTAHHRMAIGIVGVRPRDNGKPCGECIVIAQQPTHGE